MCSAKWKARFFRKPPPSLSQVGVTPGLLGRNHEWEIRCSSLPCNNFQPRLGNRFCSAFGNFKTRCPTLRVLRISSFKLYCRGRASPAAQLYRFDVHSVSLKLHFIYYKSIQPQLNNFARPLKLCGLRGRCLMACRQQETS